MPSVECRLGFRYYCCEAKYNRLLWHWRWHNRRLIYVSQTTPSMFRGHLIQQPTMPMPRLIYVSLVSKRFLVLFGGVSGNSNFYDKKNVNASTHAPGLDELATRTGALITLLPFNAKCLNFSVLEHRFGAYYSQATRFFMAHSFWLGNWTLLRRTGTCNS